MPTWARFLVVTLLWGGTWYAIRLQTGYLPVGWAITIRSVLALAAAVPLALWSRQLRLLSLRQHILLAGFGLFLFGLNLIMIYHASPFVPAGLIAVAFSLMVVGNPLVARLFLGHPFNPLLLVAAALGVSGVACLFWPQVKDFDIEDVGVQALGMLMLGMLSACVGNLFPLLQPLRKVPVMTMNVWGLAYGAILTGAYATAHGPLPPLSHDAAFLGSLIYLSIFGTLLSFTFYIDVIRDWGMARAGFAAVLAPVVALTISTFREGFVWTHLAMAGALLALSGATMAVVHGVRRS